MVTPRFDTWWRSQGELLAPGDLRARALDLSAFELHAVTSPHDRWFDIAYELLAQHFGPRQQLESRDILARRLASREHRLPRGWTGRYEFIVLVHGTEVVGVRDHVLFSAPDADGWMPIYQEHIFVVPAWRRKGIAAWLRALPLISATYLRLVGEVQFDRATLCAEIEIPARDDGAEVAALRGYIQAGYGVLDPSFEYRQPNAAPAPTSARAASTPMYLALRTTGTTTPASLPGSEVARAVEAMYSLHEDEFPEQDIRELWPLVDALSREEKVKLLHSAPSLVAAAPKSAPSTKTS